GAAEHCAELRHRARDAGGVPDRDDHHRHVDVATEEPGAAPLASHRAVNTEKGRRSGHALAVEQITDGLISRDAVDVFLAPDVDGEFCGVADVSWHSEIHYLAADEPGPFQGDESGWRHVDDVLDKRDHLVAQVDRGDRDGWVLGKAQPLV